MTDADIQNQHEKFMQAALDQAKKARDADQVPVGAVIVRDEQIIAESGNFRAAGKDPTAHAEVLVIRKAAEITGDWRLSDCDLYVTLEPCVMCSGAIILARLRSVIYGASDPKAGAVGSLFNLLADSRLNHQPEITSGVLADECSQILTDFFRYQRSLGKK